MFAADVKKKRKKKKREKEKRKEREKRRKKMIFYCVYFGWNRSSQFVIADIKKRKICVGENFWRY